MFFFFINRIINNTWLINKSILYLVDIIVIARGSQHGMERSFFAKHLADIQLTDLGSR